MTSSPYQPKKARASLTCNISTFFEPGESSTVDISETLSSEDVNHDNQLCESEMTKPLSTEDQFYFAQNLSKDQSALNEKMQHSPIMNQIFLFSMNGQASSINKFSNDSTEPTSAVKFAGKKPLIISELPQPFYSSQCFQTFDSHYLQDLAILNLYDTVKLVRPFDEDILITRLLGSETFIGSVGLGKGRLDGYFMTSDMSSHVCVYESETRKRLRKYNVTRPTKNFASRIQQEKTQLYCGFTDGSIRIFDVRMKSNIFYFPNSTSNTGGSVQQQADLVAFDPITSLETNGDFYLLSTSTKKLCLWDLRKGMNVCTIEEELGEGLMKGQFYSNTTQQCIVSCTKKNELKMVDMMTGRVSPLLSTGDLIQDFTYFGEAEELFVLTEKSRKFLNIEGKEMQKEVDQISEDFQESRTRSEINAYVVEADGVVSTVSKIEMGKAYYALKMNQNGTRLWALGKLQFLEI